VAAVRASGAAETPVPLTKARLSSQDSPVASKDRVLRSSLTEAPLEATKGEATQKATAAGAGKACHHPAEVVALAEAEDVAVDMAGAEQHDRFDGGKTMVVLERIEKQGSLSSCCALLLLTAWYVVNATFCPALAGQQDQVNFSSPGEAVTAMVNALKAGDNKALAAFFGSGSEDIVFSGDPIADKARREKFVSIYEEKNRLEQQGAEKAVLYLGNEDWPFPIPLVKIEGAWRFDSNEGRDEILARRIGRNELNVIQVCHAYVDAQREYALKDWDGDGLLVYARKFASSPGKKDGLYWETKQGEDQSPLGPLVATAQQRGYAGIQPSDNPVPYYGYYYHILEAQGANAKGGAYDYVASGKMLGGFALVAYPANYGASGIMTFIVNHDGVVFQKDLGENTKDIVSALTLFDPEGTWKKVDETTAQEKS